MLPKTEERTLPKKSAMSEVILDRNAIKSALIRSFRFTKIKLRPITACFRIISLLQFYFIYLSYTYECSAGPKTKYEITSLASLVKAFFLLISDLFHNFKSQTALQWGIISHFKPIDMPKIS